mmetsp:Transcript_154854/g.288738  ORF Transcript_154854/g.288738 Transcript_154854/m.288738 type:complete len:908 (+) Transcript_154854:33-2756(+)
MGRFGDWSASRRGNSAIAAGRPDSLNVASKPPTTVPDPVQITRTEDGRWEELEQVEWFRVLAAQVVVHVEPTEAAAVAGKMSRGQTFQVRTISAYNGCGIRWVELTPFELWRTFPGSAARQDRGFVRVFGQNAEQMVQELTEEDSARWDPVPDSMKFKPPRELRNSSGVMLSRWLPSSEALAWTPSSALDQGSTNIPTNDSEERPLLGIGTMLKGAPPNDVLHWILYHMKLKFERLYLYFDDDTAPAIPIARRFEKDKMSGSDASYVVVRVMNEEWWREAQRRSRYYVFRHKDWAARVYEWLEEIQDVTCKQQVALDIAAQEAESDGVDWLLHIDIDELFYIPQETYREDAPGWFARVPEHIKLLKFSNHECAPETLEVSDWFRDVSLFKVNWEFLKPRDKWLQKAVIDKELSGKGYIPSQSSFGPVMRSQFSIPAYMSRTPRDTCYLNNPEDDEKVDRPYSQVRVPERWQGQNNGTSQESSNLVVSGSAMQRYVRSWVCNEYQEPESETMMKELVEALGNARRRKAEQLGMSIRDLASSSNSKGDPSAAWNFGLYFTHFLAYTEGKAAVRLHIGMQAPLPSFVTSFCSLDSKGNLCSILTRPADGDADPVILHYANCGFSYWVQKYKMLGDFANDKGGGSNMIAHRAARDVVKARNWKRLEKFYRLFVMGNELGEHRVLEDLGALVRVPGVRPIINAALCQYAAESQTSLETLPAFHFDVEEEPERQPKTEAEPEATAVPDEPVHTKSAATDQALSFFQQLYGQSPPQPESKAEPLPPSKEVRVSRQDVDKTLEHPETLAKSLLRTTTEPTSVSTAAATELARALTKEALARIYKVSQEALAPRHQASRLAGSRIPDAVTLNEAPEQPKATVELEATLQSALETLAALKSGHKAALETEFRAMQES